MADDDDRVVDGVERVERRTCAFLVVGIGIVERKVRGDGVVPARA